MFISPITPNKITRNNTNKKNKINFTAKVHRCDICGKVAYEKDELNDIVKLLMKMPEDKFEQKLEQLRAFLPSPEKHAVTLMFSIIDQNKKQSFISMKKAKKEAIEAYILKLNSLKADLSHSELNALKSTLQNAEKIKTQLDLSESLDPIIFKLEEQKAEKKRVFLLTNPPRNGIKYNEEERKALKQYMDADDDIKQGLKNAKKARVEAENKAQMYIEVLTHNYDKELFSLQKNKVTYNSPKNTAQKTLLDKTEKMLELYSQMNIPENLIKTAPPLCDGLEIMKLTISQVHKTLSSNDGLLPEEKFILKNSTCPTSLLRAILSPLSIDNSLAITKILKGQVPKQQDEATCRNCNPGRGDDKQILEQQIDALSNFEKYLKGMQELINRKINAYKAFLEKQGGAQ